DRWQFGCLGERPPGNWLTNAPRPGTTGARGVRMAQFQTRIADGLALVTFDSGSMNTLSRAAVEELETVEADVRAQHAKAPLAAVVLLGNRYGLGAGANIGELMQGSAADLASLI